MHGYNLAYQRAYRGSQERIDARDHWFGGESNDTVGLSGQASELELPAQGDQ